MDPTIVRKLLNVLRTTIMLHKAKANSSTSSRAVADGILVAMLTMVMATLGHPILRAALAHFNTSKRLLSFCSQRRSQLDLKLIRTSLSLDRQVHRCREDGPTRRNHCLLNLGMLLKVRREYSTPIPKKRLLAAGVLRETVASNVSPGMAL